MLKIGFLLLGLFLSFYLCTYKNKRLGFLIVLLLFLNCALAFGASNFPGSLDSYSTKSSGDTIAEGHVNDPQDAIEAIEAKAGTGASTPTDSNVLTGTGVGTSAWAKVEMANMVSGTLATGNGGTGATAAANGANGVVVLDASAYCPDDSVDTGALKTATSEQSKAGNSYGSGTAVTGGSYCFWPQMKVSGSHNCYVGVWSPSAINAQSFSDTSYTTNVWHVSTGAFTLYTQFRYVTSSGTDWWIWLLIDKSTTEIMGASAALDHPSYGNGGDIEKVPHPFNSYDKNKHEIILLDKDTCGIIKQKSDITGKSILTLVHEDYKPNMIKTEEYEPLHSGKFLTKAPVMIASIPDYVKVRKLLPLTIQDKEDRRLLMEAKKLKDEQKKQDKKNKLEDLKQKLNLTDEEMELLRR